VAGKLVSASIQLGISHPFFVINDCDCIRCVGYLSLAQFVYASGRSLGAASTLIELVK
jgi:hypothetical protein